MPHAEIVLPLDLFLIQFQYTNFSQCNIICSPILFFLSSSSSYPPHPHPPPRGRCNVSFFLLCSNCSPVLSLLFFPPELLPWGTGAAHTHFILAITSSATALVILFNLAFIPCALEPVCPGLTSDLSVLYFYFYYGFFWRFNCEGDVNK